jgi:hypothetical protein
MPQARGAGRGRAAPGRGNSPGRGATTGTAASTASAAAPAGKKAVITDGGGKVASTDGLAGLTEANLRKLVGEAVETHLRKAAVSVTSKAKGGAAGRGKRTRSAAIVSSSSSLSSSSVSSADTDGSSSSSRSSGRRRRRRRDHSSRSAAFKAPSRRRILRMSRTEIADLDVRTVAKVPEVWETWSDAAADPAEAMARCKSLIFEIETDALRPTGATGSMGGAFYEIPFLKRLLSAVISPRPADDKLQEVVHVLGLRIGYVKAASTGGVKSASVFWKARADLSLEDPKLRKAMKGDKKKKHEGSKKKKKK